MYSNSTGRHYLAVALGLTCACYLNLLQLQLEIANQERAQLRHRSAIPRPVFPLSVRY